MESIVSRPKRRKRQRKKHQKTKTPGLLDSISWMTLKRHPSQSQDASAGAAAKAEAGAEGAARLVAPALVLVHAPDVALVKKENKE